jgi:hypothetical protein
LSEDRRGIPAEFPITMTLSAQSWVVIQTLLRKAPYEVAAPILATLSKEFDTAVAAAMGAPPPLGGVRGNGETHPDPG